MYMTKQSIIGRVRFSGVNQVKTEESGSVIDRRIPPQKTQSFKEKKKTQNWFQRRFSGQMSQDYDSIVEIEHATAVAAAAFAVKSIEESAVSDKKRTGDETSDSLVKIKSKKEETTISKPEPGRLSKLFSGLTKSTQEDPDSKVPISTSPTFPNDKIPGKTILPAPSIKRTPTSDAIHPAPSMKKTPTFADKPLNSTSSIKPETSAPKLNLPTTMKPAAPANETKGQSAARPGVVKTKADKWEEAEMAKLKERYERQNATILSWENKKKKKSKLRLEKRESETERRRVKALQKYNNEMEFIKQIAEGARAQAEEKRRNKELKVKEKANTLRRTGEEAPTTCCCF
ncbi:uncharacterized protein At3g61260-like isoform X2 [Rosa rugosa]|uniref:uncharacterized protein At3g61260-like isoform X2 n=1 Tax=Rosa rugosa TaxID=74645 RepID=UPI002B4013F7|nr:uncharacterized protein At3g61260-like isoform X2 [Rosa rugosa]